jgi:hypothetical protein
MIPSQKNSANGHIALMSYLKLKKGQAKWKRQKTQGCSDYYLLSMVACFHEQEDIGICEDWSISKEKL